MGRSDKDKGDEILKRRRLTAKGLLVRSDGRPIDPMDAFHTVDPYDKGLAPVDPEDGEKRVAERVMPVAAALRKTS